MMVFETLRGFLMSIFDKGASGELYRAGINGQQQQEQAPMPDAEPETRVVDGFTDLRDRVSLLEEQMKFLGANKVDAGPISNAFLGLQERLGTVEKVVNALSQQRASAEVQLELNARVAALDLAIKASGPGADGDAIVAMGEAFLAWMKASRS